MRLWIWVLMTSLCWAQPGIQELGREYQELRKQKGHFTGGGDWNEAVDRWEGRKHKVMAELNTMLVGQSVETLLAVMGPPDARDSTHWIYYWRGRHDYLYFDCRGGKILKSDWWMAGE